MSKEHRKPGREERKPKRAGAKTQSSDYQQRQAAAVKTAFKIKKA
ncbi:MAG: hypothetical protein AB7E79_16505 [Rhodospirillaceae bacterium]